MPALFARSGLFYAQECGQPGSLPLSPATPTSHAAHSCDVHIPRQSPVKSPRPTVDMDQSGQYVQPPSHQRHQRFPSSQLPPPSQLLPGSSYNNRSITLPPINSLPQASSRYAPYPHHSSPVSSSHPSSQLPWQNQSIPREDPVQRPQPPVKQESHPLSHREPPESSGSQSISSRHDPTEDSMSSTSDFVKKLYKYGSALHSPVWRHGLS